MPAVRSDHRGRGAVAELEHREQRLDLLGLLEMQRAQLDRHHQHPRLRPGTDDVMRGPQRKTAA